MLTSFNYMPPLMPYAVRAEFVNHAGRLSLKVLVDIVPAMLSTSRQTWRRRMAFL